MKEDLKPDNIVFNIESQKYDASIRPYPTSVGAPVISVSDSSAWKNRSVNKINNNLNAKYFELKLQYEQMLHDYNCNKLIFESNFTFEPIIGKTYHLYRRTNNETFLSIIAPEECNFNCIGSFMFNTDLTWKKV